MFLIKIEMFLNRLETNVDWIMAVCHLGDRYHYGRNRRMRAIKDMFIFPDLCTGRSNDSSVRCASSMGSSPGRKTFDEEGFNYDFLLDEKLVRRPFSESDNDDDDSFSK